MAKLLNKLLIEQTKSRPRRPNDNGLVEAGALVGPEPRHRTRKETSTPGRVPPAPGSSFNEDMLASQELTLASQQNMERARFMPVMDIQQAVTRREMIVDATQKLMKQGVDFGKIPGTEATFCCSRAQTGSATCSVWWLSTKPTRPSKTGMARNTAANRSSITRSAGGLTAAPFSWGKASGRNQQAGRKLNPDAADVVNTVLKDGP